MTRGFCNIILSPNWRGHFKFFSHKIDFLSPCQPSVLTGSRGAVTVGNGAALRVSVLLFGRVSDVSAGGPLGGGGEVAGAACDVTPRGAESHLVSDLGRPHLDY